MSQASREYHCLRAFASGQRDPFNHGRTQQNRIIGLARSRGAEAATVQSPPAQASTPLPTQTPHGHPLGQPTYPRPGPGFEWMGSYDPSGTWREAWVFVGSATGELEAETAMQYAQRMGVPASVLSSMTSKQMVDDYVAQRDGKAKPPPASSSSWDDVYAGIASQGGQAPSAPDDEKPL